MSGAARAKESEEISSRSLGSLVNLVNADERKEVERASRRLVLPDSNSKIGYSQASRQENAPHATRKLVLEDQNQTESDEREKILTPHALGNLLLRHQSKKWNTRTINTRARSFSVCGRSWECPQLTQHSQWRHTKH